ncbi:MAG: Fic family protein [Bacteroidota bacterium]
MGKPYDSGRLELFQTLIAELLKQSFPSLAEKTNSQVAYQNLAFFESYFSNYIEGTVFTVAEARDIIFKNIRIPNRTGDSHDISGTYEVCAFRERLEQEAKEPNDFLALIESHHSEVMRGRPDKRPGKFKIRANRAGSTYFVDPNKVIGSLEQAFVLLRGIKSPFARATFVMFALSEIHPFTDGNGRLARIMMNAELSRAGESKIIIPTVYRADYMLNLRKLTRDKDPAPYVRMMYRIWQWTHWLEPDNLGSMEAQLIGCNAFLHDDEGAIIFPEGI